MKLRLLMEDMNAANKQRQITMISGLPLYTIYSVLTR